MRMRVEGAYMVRVMRCRLLCAHARCRLLCVRTRCRLPVLACLCEHAALSCVCTHNVECQRIRMWYLMPLLLWRRVTCSLCILPHSDGSRRRGVLCLCTLARVEGMGAGDAASSACVSMCGVTVGCQGIVKGVVDSSSVITTRSCLLLEDGQYRRERVATAS